MFRSRNYLISALAPTPAQLLPLFWLQLRLNFFLYFGSISGSTFSSFFWLRLQLRLRVHFFLHFGSGSGTGSSPSPIAPLKNFRSRNYLISALAPTPAQLFLLFWLRLNFFLYFGSISGSTFSSFFGSGSGSTFSFILALAPAPAQAPDLNRHLKM